MLILTNKEELCQLQSSGALFILFGGPSCAVCSNLKPKLDEIIIQRLPEMNFIYIDCELTPDICAQFNVFSLPVVKVYIEGMLIAEGVRNFGIEALIQQIERSYQMWIASIDNKDNFSTYSE